MAAKKRSAKTKTRTVNRTAPRRKAKNATGVKDIPAAAMTVGIIAANAQPIRAFVGDMSINGAKNAAKAAIEPEQLKKTAGYALGGAVAGYAVQKFAPKFLKKPLGMVAKKIKAVF